MLLLDLVLQLSLVVLVVVACYKDLTARRIPNVLTITAFCFALVVRVLFDYQAAGTGLLVAAVIFTATLPVFAMGGLGGGDAKFLTSAAMHLDPGEVLLMVFFTGVSGAVLAVGQAVRQRTIIPLLLDSGQLALRLVTIGRKGRLVGNGAAARTPPIPYGVAIGIGALIARFL